MSKKRRAAKHLALYASSTVIRQMVGFLMLPIYTRHLSPADYGVLALLSLMLFVSEAVIGARFVQAIPKFYFDHKTDEKRLLVVSTAMLLTVGVSLVGLGLIVLGAEQLSLLLFDTSQYTGYVAIYGSLIVTMAIEAYGFTFLRLLDKPGLFFVGSLVRMFFQLALSIYFVVILDLKIAGVIAATVISSVCFGLFFAVYTFKHAGIRFDRKIGIGMVRFSWPLWLSGLATLYVSTSNRYFIRIFSDLTDVGLFELAARFASLLPVFTWIPFSQWWQTESFSLFQRADKGRPVFETVFNLVVMMTVAGAVGVAIFSGPVIRIMAAPEFHQSTSAVASLVFAAAFYQLAMFMNFSFLAVERTQLLASITWITAIAVTVAYILLVPKFGYVGAGYGLLAVNILAFVITYMLAKRINDIGVNLKPMYGLLTIGAAVTAVDYALGQEHPIIIALAYKSALAALMLGMFYMIATKMQSTRGLFHEFQRHLFSKLSELVKNR